MVGRRVFSRTTGGTSTLTSTRRDRRCIRSAKSSRNSEGTMRWELGRRSDNVEDARGEGGGGGGGFGLPHLSAGGIVVALLASYMFGVNPLQMLGFIAQLQGD